MVEVYRIYADSSRLLVCHCQTPEYAPMVAETGIDQGLAREYALREGDVESLVVSAVPVDNSPAL